MKYNLNGEKENYQDNYITPIIPSIGECEQNIYNFKLPSNIDIFTNINIKDIDFKNPKVKENLELFIDIFRKAMENYCSNHNILNQLNKLIISQDEDGAASIGWNYNNFRISFSFEINEEESSYVIVTDDKTTGEYSSRSGFLNKEKYNSVLIQIIKFVLENT